ncbi:MAG TPA: hypothetical protein VFY48_10060 [Solirubrobacterales bacterium]|nr:hypothetical protein [Solirubrobacterales bacterium]
MAASAESAALSQTGGERQVEPVVYSDCTVAEALLAGMQKEFPRPPTRLNRTIAGLVERLPSRELRDEDVRRWLHSSIEVFSTFVDDPSALDRVRREVAWVISDQDPPDWDIWSGECKFIRDAVPIVICYSTTLASRLPGETFDLAWQGAMDHFVGHLYPYFHGATDPSEYDEAVACRYQHLAAQLRGRTDRRFRGIARLLPLTYRLHKEIPLSNYQKLGAGRLSGEGGIRTHEAG